MPTSPYAGMPTRFALAVENREPSRHPWVWGMRATAAVVVVADTGLILPLKEVAPAISLGFNRTTSTSRCGAPASHQHINVGLPLSLPRRRLGPPCDVHPSHRAGSQKPHPNVRSLVSQARFDGDHGLRGTWSGSDGAER